MNKYVVIVGSSTFQLNAKTLKDAKKLANFHKRMEAYKGATSVKRLKK